MEKFNYIKEEILQFEPSKELEEFIDNIPLNYPMTSIITKEKTIIDLIRNLKLHSLIETYDLFENIFNEVLQYSKNIKDPQERKILLSFVSDFNSFISMSAYILQTSFTVPSKELFLLFPDNLRESFIMYNNYVNEFSGIRDSSKHEKNSLSTPFLEMFSAYNSHLEYQSKIGLTFQISRYKNEKGLSFNLINAFLNGGEEIKISYGEKGGNNELILLKGSIIKDNFCNNQEINLNFTDLNFTEHQTKVCDKIDCSGLSKNVLNDYNLLNSLNFHIYKGYTNLKLLNVIRLSYLNISKLSDFNTIHKLKSYLPLDYETEMKTLLYFNKLIKEQDTLDTEFLYDDINNFYNLFSRLRKSKVNAYEKFSFYERHFNFYILAKEKKEIVYYNYNYVLDEMKQRLNRELIAIKQLIYK